MKCTVVVKRFFSKYNISLLKNAYYTNIRYYYYCKVRSEQLEAGPASCTGACFLSESAVTRPSHEMTVHSQGLRRSLQHLPFPPGRQPPGKLPQSTFS